MKIALIVPGFSRDERDWCIPALLDLARALAREAEVHVFTMRWPERRATYRVHGATVHAMDGRPRLGVKVLGLWRRTSAEIAREHRRAPFDAIHALWADEPGWVAAWAGRRLGVPVVVSLCGGEIVSIPEIGYGLRLRAVHPRLTRWAMRRAAVVTAGSRHLLEIAAGFLPAADRAKLVHAPLGVDTDLFSPGARAPAPAPTILNVGSLTPVKDQETLLRAFRRAEIPDARLAIAGDGPLRPRLEQLAAALGLAGRVAFLGSVDHGAMPDLYRGADLLVQSSRHEAQGMAVLEAAACGVPLAGTAAGVLPELAPAVPPNDAPALAAAMRERLGRRDEALARRVRSDYSLEAATRRFLGLYAAL